MLTTLLPLTLALAVAAASSNIDAATRQLSDFKKHKKGSVGILTTSSGAPVEYEEATSTLNTDLLSNGYLLDDMLKLNRERIPERILHAHGAGALGYFEVTHDITQFCKAKVFSKVGKKTPVTARFSLGFSSKGVNDAIRETRALVVKLYTEEGNFDLLGLNTPIFAFKDPLLFSPLVHVLKPNPVTNIRDWNMIWDFMTLHPEGLFNFLYVFSDFGMPAGYDHMPSYPIHTYQVYNEEGVSSFMRFHMVPVAGIKNFNATEAVAIAANDTNYYGRRLYNLIANGQYPKWYLKAQIISDEERRNCDIDIFDVTITLPQDLFPLQTVGIITLDKNPSNYFAQVEEFAGCPGNVVPGVLGSPDSLFAVRRFSYQDAQHYRLGSNFNKIPVNAPINTGVTYIRDGHSPVNDNGGSNPNYFPNSFDDVTVYRDKNRPSFVKTFEKPPNNFKQAGEFYLYKLTSEQKKSLVDNIVQNLCLCEGFIQKRAVKWFTVIHPDLGKRVAKALANCAK